MAHDEFLVHEAFESWVGFQNVPVVFNDIFYGWVAGVIGYCAEERSGL